MNNWQRDQKWINTTLGFGTTQTIGNDGCLISVLGNIIGVDPIIVNERLKAVNGFAGALVIWAKIEEAFPGIKVRRVWNYNNDDVKANIPNVVVAVPATAIGGAGTHWVQFIGNHMCRDPWTATDRQINDFTQYGNPSGYCVISGEWNQHPGDDVLVNEIKSEIDSSDDPKTKIDKIRSILNF